MDLEENISKDYKENIKEGLITSSIIAIGTASAYLMGQAYLKFFNEITEVINNYLSNHINF